MVKFQRPKEGLNWEPRTYNVKKQPFRGVPNDTYREKLFYSIQYKDGWFAAVNY